MLLHNQIIGKYSKLRSVITDDAEFILSLRLDNNLNKYINKVEDSVLKQKAWIKRQQNETGDYYFLILDLEDKPLGTIALYNIKNQEAEFGRWVSKGGVIHNIESVILLHKFGFENLNLNKIYTNTVRENKSVINFHKRFGAKLSQFSHFDSVSGFNFIGGVIEKIDFNMIEGKNYKILEALL